MSKIWYFNLLAAFVLTAASCTPTPHDVQQTEDLLSLYPDYKNICIPCNMAPLNFLVRNEGVDAVQIQVSDLTWTNRGNAIVWSETDWHSLTKQYTGDTLQVSLTARIKGQWQKFATFYWYICPDSIDRYVTYRLIEPGYEVWHEVDIEERCIENFQTRTLANGKQLGNRCMNCHTHGGDKGQFSYFYIRGEQGGTIVQRNGELRKVSLSSPRANGGSVYGDWHPSGRYGVFSSNKIIPAFHSNPAQRLEVYDTRSDLMVVDFDQDTILTCKEISQSQEMLETFPCFSADGTYIYYCAAPNPISGKEATAQEMQTAIDTLQYSLYQIPFSSEQGIIGLPERLYTIDKGSISFPKCSPDGQYMALSYSQNGTFPIWHREARMIILHIERDHEGNSKTLQPLCQTDIHATYHTWSHNSRWLAFASKEADTQYSRIHFVHLDKDSTGALRLSKPIVLPQQDPNADDMNLRSFNIPDLSQQSMPYGTQQIQNLMERVQATPFK